MPRALIVDDKAENLSYLEAMLRGNGYSVDRAGNGTEALASARANPPDLVITDILMPGMDGFALCRQWKQDPRLRRIPFVFYTATYTDSKDEQLARNLGADLFLIKPQEPDAFMRQIAGVLQQHEDGTLLLPPVIPMEESSYLREYNAALVHKLEDKLVQLERTSKVKEVLLGSISHQLRTPLTPVTLLVGLLIQDPDTPPRMRRDLDTIRRNIEIEKRLISDLIDYAVMQCGHLRLHTQPLSIHALAQQTAALWQGQIQAEALRLDLRLEAPFDQILGDANRLEQVLWSLMHNAVRRSPQGASITFHTWNPRPDCIVLEVRDAGKEMDAEAIAWAFSPFERKTRIGEGSAREMDLGLAVSKGIVEAHGGTMSIQSQSQVPEAAVTIQLPVSARTSN
jgi:signal transduction histidine kinase